MMATNNDIAPGNSTLSRNYSLNSGSSRDRENEALKQQLDKANSESITLRARLAHAMKELDYYRHHAKMDSGQVIDFDNLRKCYEELDESHAQTLLKLEMAQDETKRISKQYEEVNQERNTSLREVSGLKQQITKAYSQMDKLIRDCNKFREALQISQQKYDDAVKEVKQALTFRQKANKEVQRLTEERNATMTEYNLIMSERDTVHKEMERLSDDLSQAKRKNKLLESDNKDLLEEKQGLNNQLESLRREIASALHDRDKALKECNDLREKFGEYTTKEDNVLKSPLNCNYAQGENSMRKEIQVANFSQRQRLDNLDQANQELESLRKSLDKTQLELTEALQEADVSKGRRDWAFSERDKIVLERESIRTLCDKMRKERDRAVSELAESLRESDAIKKQRNELLKEVKTLKETLEMHMEKESNLNQGFLAHNHSHDSAIDSDMQEWETETLEMDLTGMSIEKDIGFDLGGGIEDAQYPNHDVYVTDVAKGTVADGKLRINDCIVRVNNLDCTKNMTKRIVMDTIRSSAPIVHLLVRRRRRNNWSGVSSNNSSLPTSPNTPQTPAKVARWVHTAKLPPGLSHGIMLESGVYISKICEGGLAGKDTSLVVGDRVLRVNHKSMDGCDAIHDAMRILNERNDSITITTLKMSYLDTENTNVFIPVQRYKKENRSSQTDDLHYYSQPSSYPSSNSSGGHTCNNSSRLTVDHNRAKSAQEKSHAWLREKFDLVRGRRHSKDRNRTLEDKKRQGHAEDMSLNGNYEHEKVIAELDSIIDTHGQPNNSSTFKRPKHRSKESSLQEKNGGTWPKTRATILGTASNVGTITNRTKQRPPLSLLISNTDGEDYLFDSSVGVPNSAQLRNTNSTIINSNRSTMSAMSNISNESSNHSQMPLPRASNRHSSVISGFGNDSYEKLRHNRLSINMKSDDSLDFNPPIKPRIGDKDIKYYHTSPYMPHVSKQPKYSSDSERESLLHHDIAMQVHQVRLQSPLFAPRVPFPFHPHPHPHLNMASTNSNNSSHSRESVGGYELPAYNPIHYHGHSLSAEVHQKRPMLGMNTIASQHSQLDREIRDSREYYTPGGFELPNVGTFPRKGKENQRFRIPSNPSVNSKNSTGKISTGSIERTSERGSPSPIFNVEILKRSNVPEYGWSQKQLSGELRKVYIDKSNEPLGIQINCPDSGGIFVSRVDENSLASRVGLQIGDQLLEVCGINMRNATYDLAANVLRQCGNSITMLVHSPDKFVEIEEGSGSEDNSCSSSAEPTPCNSPKENRKSLSLSSSNTNQRSLQQTNRDSQQRQSTSRSSKAKSTVSTEDEPRCLYIETHKTSNLGISLVGGNAVGIFIHSVQRDSLAEHAGLRTGDQILEYNGADLRVLTAEEAAYILAKPADKVTVFAHYRIDRYNEIKDKPGDSLYVRCGFDRSGSDLTDNDQLYFNKDDILYVDNTMFRGNPGHWLAWKLDSEGNPSMQWGIIPSKYKVEEQLMLRRSSGDLESRGSTSARRSFFRRKKHQRSGSRDSKELASFSNVSSGWYSDNGTMEDLSLCSYQRVERLDCPEFRPVLVLGPLAECVVEKLIADFPDKFRKCVIEIRQNQAQLEQEIAENLIIDYKRKGNYFECTTVSAIKQICISQQHCMIDIPISCVEKLHRHQIYPIVLLIKFKSTKHIKEIKDTRFSLDKLSGKAAKEMYEHCQKLEAEYRHLITAVIPAGVNVTYMSTQVLTAVDSVHSKSQWVPV
ncbi:disks large homolog 5 isoform X1 [Atheta coriaria]|uniref:disks large homolog 5 isoform X1 n=1 Tax=Dalotia coriaria TaxID=877792 RepID=UPI0031F36DF5